MTPFILAILCLIISERQFDYSRNKSGLRDEVRQMLVDYPAKSWLSISKAPRDPGTGQIDEDYLNPEIGIGPEEIVGACILAAFWSEGQGTAAADAGHYAFKWARGWIKVSPARGMVWS